MRDRGDRLAHASDAVSAGLSSAQAEDLPPLPGSRQELRRIAKRFAGRATVKLGREAIDATVRSTVPAHRYVHFPTHGFVDDQRPLYSGLVLSQEAATEGNRTADGLLQAHELFDLPLDGAVVVCSACETGIGLLRAGEGEGIVGLSRALFYAGAEPLVLSLWRAPDKVTAELMDELYAKVLAGHGVAHALRLARWPLRRRSVVEDPFLWGVFVVVGVG